MFSRIRWLASVTTMVGALLLASCSTPTLPAPSGATAGAKPYGSLIYGWTNVAEGRLTDQSAMFAGVGAAAFDTFFGLDSEGQITPGIVERWEIAPDGKTQTLYVRKGVKFHNGDDLTAADVKFSIERIMDPKLVSLNVAARGVWTAQIVSLALKDDYTLVVHLKQPQFELPTVFDQPSNAATAVLPKKYYEEKGEDYFQEHPIGSGPWKVLNYQSGVRVELEANENYWGEIPKFKNLTILFVMEEGVKVAMLKTGELDIAMVAPDSVATLKAAGLRIVAHDGSSQIPLAVWSDPEQRQKYPTNDIRVRRALSLGINRKELGDHIFAGYAEPAAVYKVVKTAYFFDANVVKPDPYDPEQAKKLLAEAGYAGGFDLKIWNTAGDVEKQINQALAGYWRKLGINGYLANMDYGVFKPLMRPVPQPELYGTVWSTTGGGNVWHDEQLRTMYNYPGLWHQKKIDRYVEILEKLPLTADPAEKKRMLLEATVLVKNDYSGIPLIDVKTIFALGPKVGGFTPIKGAHTFLGTTYGSVTHAK